MKNLKTLFTVLILLFAITVKATDPPYTPGEFKNIDYYKVYRGCYGYTSYVKKDFVNQDLAKVYAGIIAIPQPPPAWYLTGNTNGSLKKFGTLDSVDLTFYTKNLERIKLFADGTQNFGGSPYRPLSKYDFNVVDSYDGITLEHNHGAQIQLFYQNGYGGRFMINAEDGSPAISLFGSNYVSYINNGQNFGIGTTTPTAKLSVNGTVNFNGLPNDGTGLATGDLYNLAGVLRIKY